MRIRFLAGLMFLLLLMCLPAEAQYSPVSGFCSDGGTVTVSGLPASNSVMLVYPNCSVTVYVTGTLTLATIYSNSTGTVLSNPFTANSDGSWKFYAPSGVYDVTMAGAGIITPFTFTGTATGQAGGAIWLPEGSSPPTPKAGYDILYASSTNHALTLSNNGGAFGILPLSPDPSAAVVYVAATCAGGVACSDSNNGLSWGSAKVTIGAAYAALPASGGVIRVAGNQTYSTGISFSTSTKPVMIKCVQGTNNNNPPFSGPTTLTYTGTGAFFTFNNGNLHGGMEGCTLVGPDGTTGATAQGVLLGGTNSASYSYFDNDDISGFGDGGLAFTTNSYVNTFVNMTIHDNGPVATAINILFPPGISNAGENTNFIGGSFSNKGSGFNTACVDLENGGDFHFIGTSFDQCGMTINNQAEVDLTSPHFENPNAATAKDFITIGAAGSAYRLNIVNGVFAEDGASTRTEFIGENSSVTNHGGFINIVGTTFSAAENGTVVLKNLTANCCAQSYIGEMGTAGGDAVGTTSGFFFVNNSYSQGVMQLGGGTLSVGGGLAISDSAATCSMSAGTTCTITVPSGSAHCVATVQGSTAIAGACSITGTTATVTAASSNSDTWLVMVTQ